MPYSYVKSIMSNKLQKTLAYQEKVNNAVKKLIESFNPRNSMSLSEHYRLLAEVQVQVFSAIQLCERLVERGDNEACETVFTPCDVTSFFSCVLDIYKLLEPFDDMAQEDWQLSRQKD